MTETEKAVADMEDKKYRIDTDYQGYVAIEYVSGVAAYVYRAYMHPKKNCFTLYPMKGGYLAPGADVRRKTIYFDEIK